MKILAIETSCDETAVAIVQATIPMSKISTGHHKDRQITELADLRLLANVVVSQIDIFAEYGGVIPEISARSHLEAILPAVHRAFAQADLTWDDIDGIAVTHTPGLLGSLLIGTLTARTLAILHQKPLYAVHHLKSHIYATWLSARVTDTYKGISRAIKSTSADKINHTDKQERSLPQASKSTDAIRADDTSITTERPVFPLLALVVSGGHTQIIHMTRHNHFEIIGTTRDDAVGECFDKVAKIIGLPYPGGPAIARAAEGIIPAEILAQYAHPHTINRGNPQKYHFPHPKLKPLASSTLADKGALSERDAQINAPVSLDFSFSGLKTAVLRTVQATLGKPISFPSRQLAPLLTPQQVADFSASFQNTAVDILLEQLLQATKIYPRKSIVIAGGVSANQLLRQKAHALFAQRMNIPVFFPALQFSGDNAAMVGVAALYEIASGVGPTNPYTLNIYPRSDIS